MNPWNMKGYAGGFTVQTQPEGPPASALHAVLVGGRLKYFEGDGRQVILMPTWRQKAVAVCDDGCSSLAEELKKDRWMNVVPRG